MTDHTYEILIRGTLELYCPKCGRYIKYTSERSEVLDHGDQPHVTHEKVWGSVIITNDSEETVSIDEFTELFQRR